MGIGSLEQRALGKITHLTHGHLYVVDGIPVFHAMACSGPLAIGWLASLLVLGQLSQVHCLQAKQKGTLRPSNSLFCSTATSGSVQRGQSGPVQTAPRCVTFIGRRAYLSTRDASLLRYLRYVRTDAAATRQFALVRGFYRRKGAGTSSR